MSRPASDQIEINIFGPGFGESSAIHVGDGQWIVIDSCLDSDTGAPAALKYLNEIGVSLQTDVKLVVATHWHDDHVRGLSELFLHCSSARFCSSAALTREEFIETIQAYNIRNGMVAGSGTSEICRILNILRTRTPKSGIKALGIRKIFRADGSTMSHGHDCDVFCLSPSDLQFEQSVINVAKLLPLAFAPKRRAPSPDENALSVAMWISIGPISMLFGADLEEHGKPELGWSAILNDVALPSGASFFFKIPHHGSSNGHHPLVWAKLLQANPFAILTPWSSNKGLPQLADINRINALTSQAYSTSNGKMQRVHKRDAAVERILRYKNIQLQAIEPQTGHVRLRNGGAHNFQDWTIETAKGACMLRDFGR